MEPPKTQSCVLPQHDPTQRAEGCLTVLRTDDLEQGEHDTHVGQTNTRIKKIIADDDGLTEQINTSQADNVGQKNTLEAAKIMADDDTKQEHDACQAKKPLVANYNNATETNKNRHAKKTPILVDNELASTEDTNNKSRPKKTIIDDDASTEQAHDTCRAKKTIKVNDTSTEQRNTFLAKKTLPATNDAPSEERNTSQAVKTIARNEVSTEQEHKACQAKKNLLGHKEFDSTEKIDSTSQAKKTLLANNNNSIEQTNKTRKAKKVRNISYDKKTSLITENELASSEQINTNHTKKSLLTNYQLGTTKQRNISQVKKALLIETELDKALPVDNDTTIEHRNTEDKSTLRVDKDASSVETNTSPANKTLLTNELASTDQINICQVKKTRNTSQVKKALHDEKGLASNTHQANLLVENEKASNEQTNTTSKVKKTTNADSSNALTRLDAFNLLVAESRKINGRSAKPSDLNNEERLSVIKSALGDTLQPQFTENQQKEMDNAIGNFISKIEKKYKDCRSFMPNFTRKNRNWLNKMFISDVPQDLIKCDVENVDIATELKDLQPTCSNESHHEDFSSCQQSLSNNLK